ncbi:MAG TPA: ferredoxin [Anaeromyxobacteraceae bacterium]|nr:ferredoxin [Anaeromyxobacteraceae bacterium]
MLAAHHLGKAGCEVAGGAAEAPPIHAPFRPRDDTCVACDTYRRIAPATFGGGEDDRSFLRLQPGSPEERRRALMALVACPTTSTGSLDTFTGDHLWGDAAGRLGASRSVCWWDWEEQTRSLERLASHRFTWVLPGHGRPWRAETPEAARAAVAALALEMRRS